MAAFYKASVADFLAVEPAKLMLELTSGTAGMGFDLKADQHASWFTQVEILASALRDVVAQERDAASWSLLLEYQIPGRPKRLDAVLLDHFGILTLEFKVGADEFRSGDKWQLREYCWDLRDFHRESEGIPIAPLLVATAAPTKPVAVAAGFEDKHGIIVPLLTANAETLAQALLAAHERLTALGPHRLDVVRWDASQAHTTRTVIEVAQRLFAAHDVREVSHAHADNTTEAQDSLIGIVRQSRAEGLRSICFLTGVPGAGKTLVGLHAAYSSAMAETAGEPACFASGNQPLLDVLHAALTLNRTRDRHNRREIGHDLSAPVQNVHDFALRNLLDPEQRPPAEHVVVFDEAQRVWTGDKVEEGIRKRVQRRRLTAEQSAEVLRQEHSAAAWTAGAWLGLDPECLGAGLAGFGGTRRRFELKGEAGGVQVRDDYSHHPTEVAAALQAARGVASGRVVVVFQPHLYSRTRIFAAEFGRALELADEVVVLDVYAAREDPEPGVSGQLVSRAVALPPGQVTFAPTLDDAERVLLERLRPGDLLLTMGAGDVTTLGPRSPDGARGPGAVMIRSGRGATATAPPRRAASSGTAERFAAKVRLRRRRRWASVVAALLLAVGLGWVAVFSPWLVVKQVRVEGLDRVPSTTVHQMVDAEVGRPMVLLDPAAVGRRVAAVPLVREVEVRRRWPASVVVVVHERVAVAVVPASAGESGYRLVDRDGVEVESVTSRPDDLPYLDVNVGRAGAGALVAALEVQSQLPASVQGQLREIGATSADGVWFTVANGATVTWGDATRSEEKLAALTAVVTADPKASTYDVSAPTAPAVSTKTLRDPLTLTP